MAYTSRTPDGQPAHPDCVAALDDAAGLLAALGHELTEADLPGLDERTGQAIGVAYGAFVTWVVDYWARTVGREPGEDDLEPYTWALWEQGRTVTAGAYLMAIMDLQAFARVVAGFFTRYDVWLTPTLAAPPLPLGAMTSTGDDPWRAARAAARSSRSQPSSPTSPARRRCRCRCTGRRRAADRGARARPDWC